MGKALANLVIVAAGNGAALTALRLLIERPIVPGPVLWAGLLAAIATAGVVESVVAQAWLRAQGAVDPAPLVRQVAIDGCEAVAQLPAALMCVHALDSSAWALVPLAVCLALLVLGVREYSRLQQVHRDLERLHQFAVAISHRPAVDQVIAAVLREAAEATESADAELMFVAGESQQFAHPGPGSRVDWTTTSSIAVAQAFADALAAAAPVAVAGDADGRPGALIVPLLGDAGAVGALAVARPRDATHALDDRDQQRLAAVAERAGAALRQSRLLEDLQRDAKHDPLTGLLNRAGLRELVAAAAIPGTTILIDLDGFKAVNDAYGHTAGDRLLVEVAQRLQAEAPEALGIARLGGDEFALLVPDVGHRTADALAARLDAALRAPIAIAQATVGVGASIGIARGMSSDALHAADLAMYEAKRRGGGVARG